MKTNSDIERENMRTLKDGFIKDVVMLFEYMEKKDLSIPNGSYNDKWIFLNEYISNANSRYITEEKWFGTILAHNEIVELLAENESHRSDLWRKALHAAYDKNADNPVELADQALRAYDERFCKAKIDTYENK